jgi:hypothetical protein
MPSISSTRADISTLLAVSRAVPVMSARVVPLMCTPLLAPPLLASARDPKPAEFASAFTLP